MQVSTTDSPRHQTKRALDYKLVSPALPGIGALSAGGATPYQDPDQHSSTPGTSTTPSPTSPLEHGFILRARIMQVGLPPKPEGPDVSSYHANRIVRYFRSMQNATIQAMRLKLTHMSLCGLQWVLSPCRNCMDTLLAGVPTTPMFYLITWTCCFSQVSCRTVSWPVGASPLRCQNHVFTRMQVRAHCPSWSGPGGPHTLGIYLSGLFPLPPWAGWSCPRLVPAFM